MFDGLGEVLDVWNSHGDKLTKLPRGFRTVGRTANSQYAAIEDPKRHFYGLQFHPEATQPIAASWLRFALPPPGEEFTGPLFRNPDGAWDRAAVHASRLFSAWLDGDLAGP